MDEINYLVVEAEEINNEQFKYKCPDCFKLSSNKIVYSRFKKNGKPYLNLKPNYHYHGSCNEFSEREETRVSHCLKKNLDYDLVKIIINNNTKKK